MYFAEIAVLPIILFLPKSKLQLIKQRYIQPLMYICGNNELTSEKWSGYGYLSGFSSNLHYVCTGNTFVGLPCSHKFLLNNGLWFQYIYIHNHIIKLAHYRKYRKDYWIKWRLWILQSSPNINTMIIFFVLFLIFVKPWASMSPHLVQHIHLRHHSQFVNVILDMPFNKNCNHLSDNDICKRLPMDCPFLASFTADVSWFIDSLTVPLHSPNSRQLPAITAVQKDCHWGLKNSGNSHWSREPIMQWGTRQSQSVLRSTNHKRVMPANWRTCLIPTGASHPSS